MKDEEGKGGIYLEKENIFCGGEENGEKKKENIWRRKIFGHQRGRNMEKE